MYEYKFVKIELKTGFTTRKPVEDYHSIIDQYAAKGSRLVQIFAPPTLRRGEAEYFELIFENQIDE
jgi:hypothetical protein